MGTNFYWVSRRGERHIGKRSAAGAYCWDDGISLSTTGNPHDGAPFHRWCPRCGREPERQDLGYPGHAAGVELGFAEPNAQRPRGVATASSFTWAQDPAAVMARCRRSPGKEIVQDGYGRLYTGSAFLAMLDAQCPIRFTDSIGTEFS